LSFYDLLRPDLYLPSVYDLDLRALKARGIVALLFDIDNTLVEWRHGRTNPRLEAFFSQVAAAGLRAGIVSNGESWRVKLFADALGVPAIGNAGKPRARSYLRMLEVLGVSRDQVAVVGDQIFTDIFGGKRLGLMAILVVPVSRREFVGTRLVRLAERAVLGYLARHGLLAMTVDGVRGKSFDKTDSDRM